LFRLETGALRVELGKQERAVLSNAHPETDLARLTRVGAVFDSRTIAPND